MWLAESDGQVLGMVIFGPDPRNPDRIEIDSLYVKQETQRRGIGGRLLQKALDSRPEADAVLWVVRENTKARSFYAKNHFQPNGRNRTFTDAWTIPVQLQEVGYSLSRD